MKAANYQLKTMKKIIPFTCRTLINGNSIDLNEVKKPILINFWSITCHYSVDEIVDINNKVIYNYNDKVLFIFINCGDSVDEVNEFINKNLTKLLFKNFITQNICIDYDDYITNLLGISDIPISIILDEKLIIRHLMLGKTKIDKYINYLNDLFDDNKLKI